MMIMMSIIKKLFSVSLIFSFEKWEVTILFVCITCTHFPQLTENTQSKNDESLPPSSSTSLNSKNSWNYNRYIYMHLFFNPFFTCIAYPVCALTHKNPPSSFIVNNSQMVFFANFYPNRFTSLKQRFFFARGLNK